MKKSLQAAVHDDMGKFPIMEVLILGEFHIRKCCSEDQPVPAIS
jgi:hypothetical protein